MEKGNLSVRLVRLAVPVGEGEKKSRSGGRRGHSAQRLALAKINLSFQFSTQFALELQCSASYSLENVWSWRHSLMIRLETMHASSVVHADASAVHFRSSQ